MRRLCARKIRAVSQILSIHSMTPALAGVPQPWQISLSSHHDRSLVDPLLAVLRRPGDIIVGDKRPYDLDPREG